MSEQRTIVRSRIHVYLGLAFVVTCWGLNVVLVKSAIARLDPLAFTALRFLAMAPLGFLLAFVSRASLRIERRDLPELIACGACGFGVYQYLWVFGLAHTSAFASSLLGATAPVFTLIAVALLGRERIRAMSWIGASAALVGIAVFEGAFAGHATFRSGDALTLLSSISFAGYNVLTARLIERYSPVALVVITMTIGTLAILPVGLPRALHAPLTHLGWDVWGPFAFAVMFPIVLTWPVWNYGIAQIGAARAGLFGFLVPLVAGVAAVFILGSRFEPHQLLGAAICLSGMAVAIFFGRVSLTEIWAQRSLPLER